MFYNGFGCASVSSRMAEPLRAAPRQGNAAMYSLDTPCKVYSFGQGCANLGGRLTAAGVAGVSEMDQRKANLPISAAKPKGSVYGYAGDGIPYSLELLIRQRVAFSDPNNFQLLQVKQWSYVFERASLDC